MVVGLLQVDLIFEVLGDKLGTVHQGLHVPGNIDDLGELPNKHYFLTIREWFGLKTKTRPCVIFLYESIQGRMTSHESVNRGTVVVKFHRWSLAGQNHKKIK